MDTEKNAHALVGNCRKDLNASINFKAESNNQQEDINNRLTNYRENMVLCHKTADECQRWAFEYDQCASFWRAQAKHFALLLKLTLIKKWGGYHG